MDFLHGLLIITFVHVLAAASPGPDFVMVSQQTLTNGRRAGLLCSLGIALGLSVHIIYSACGLAAVIANSANGLLVIKMLGGCYLIYLGCKGLRSKPVTAAQSVQRGILEKTSVKTVGKGFLCNVLNPKAPIYFVSLFTIILSPELPLHYLAIYGIWIMILQFLWFAFVAMILSSPPVSKRFHSCSHYLDRLLGGAMILFGIKVLTTRAT